MSVILTLAAISAPPAAADDHAPGQQRQRQRIQRAGAEQGQQGDRHRDPHSDHAERIALAARLRAGQSPQRQDEQYA